MQELATGYQELVGDGANIAIAMAGLPSAIIDVLSDEMLTFLNRAMKEPLEMPALNDVSAYCFRTFEELGIEASAELINRASLETRGYPYLLQLIGYYLVELTGRASTLDAKALDQAILCSRRDLIDNAFAPVLKPLSQADRDFIKAMSKDAGTSRISDTRERLSASASHVQTYKTRLIEAEVIVFPRRGLVEFQLPHLGEHLRGEL